MNDEAKFINARSSFFRIFLSAVHQRQSSRLRDAMFTTSFLKRQVDQIETKIFIFFLNEEFSFRYDQRKISHHRKTYHHDSYNTLSDVSFVPYRCRSLLFLPW